MADLIGLIHEELRKALAETTTPEWLEAVRKLGEKAPRDFDVVLAFARCIRSALEPVGTFPAQFEKWRVTPEA